MFVGNSPILLLTADDDGLRVEVRPRWVFVFLTGGMGSSADGQWYRPWNQIERIITCADRGMLVPREGVACLFATPKWREFRSVLRFASDRNVRLEEVGYQDWRKVRKWQARAMPGHNPAPWSP